MDVPPHMLQPLSVDTNINYDLDISLFPGLHDPQHMYQPALLIATDWSHYVYEDEPCNTETEVIKDDLYTLIESCHDLLPDVDSLSSTEPDTLETLLEDAIIDTVICCDDFDFVDDTSSDNLQSTTSSADSAGLNELSYQELSPLSTTCVRGQKRHRSGESELQYSKKSKMADNYSIHNIPYIVSVCPTSNICVMHRDS